MLSKAKHNKKYREKHTNTPEISMGKIAHDDAFIKLWAAIETLIRRPSVSTYNHVAVQIIIFEQLFGVMDFFERAKKSIEQILARYERDKTRRIIVNEDEAVNLRAIVIEVDSRIGLISENKFATAKKFTLRWCAANDIDV